MRTHGGVFSDQRQVLRRDRCSRRVTSCVAVELLVLLCPLKGSFLSYDLQRHEQREGERNMTVAFKVHPVNHTAQSAIQFESYSNQQWVKYLSRYSCASSMLSADHQCTSNEQ